MPINYFTRFKWIMYNYKLIKDHVEKTIWPYIYILLHYLDWNLAILLGLEAYYIGIDVMFLNLQTKGKITSLVYDYDRNTITHSKLSLFQGHRYVLGV